MEKQASNTLNQTDTANNSISSEDEKHFPIRDVSQLTGVNSVTLRAWERRYGLVKPVRTPKGHRLYTASEINKIKEIVGWLNRGVAIGKVRELLGQSTATVEESGALDADEWGELIQKFVQAVLDLNEQRLDDVLNQAQAIYPLDMVSIRLVLPALQRLREIWLGQFGARLQECFLETYFRTKIGVRIYHGNRSAGTNKVVVIGLDQDASEIETLLVAQSCSAMGFRVHYLQPGVPQEEWVLAVEKIAAQALVVVGSRRNDIGALQRAMVGLNACTGLRTLFTGYLVDIHQQALAASGLPYLPLLEAISQSRLMQYLAPAP